MMQTIAVKRADAPSVSESIDWIPLDLDADGHVQRLHVARIGMAVVGDKVQAIIISDDISVAQSIVFRHPDEKFTWTNPPRPDFIPALEKMLLELFPPVVRTTN